MVVTSDLRIMKSIETSSRNTRNLSIFPWIFHCFETLVIERTNVRCSAARYLKQTYLLVKRSFITTLTSLTIQSSSLFSKLTKSHCQFVGTKQCRIFKGRVTYSYFWAIWNKYVSKMSALIHLKQRKRLNDLLIRQFLN